MRLTDDEAGDIMRTPAALATSDEIGVMAVGGLGAEFDADEEEDGVDDDDNDEDELAKAFFGGFGGETIPGTNAAEDFELDSDVVDWLFEA
jgi:hypothetical protein